MNPMIGKFQSISVGDRSRALANYDPKMVDSGSIQYDSIEPFCDPWRFDWSTVLPQNILRARQHGSRKQGPSGCDVVVCGLLREVGVTIRESEIILVTGPKFESKPKPSQASLCFSSTNKQPTAPIL
jgi:hypothetical protein